MKKLKKPEFMNNITRKMVVTWAVLFVGLLVLGFGMASIVLGVQHKVYGAPINFGNIQMIEFKNQYHPSGDWIAPRHNQANHLHTIISRDIMTYLNRGRRTTRLSNLFRGNPEQQVLNNATGADNTFSFDSNYSGRALIIRFNQPQHGVWDIGGNRREFELVDLPVAADSNIPVHHVRNVYEIRIPMNRTTNSFQSQTWYLVTQNPMEVTAGSSLHISHIISTYGNYHRLWRFINDLRPL